MSTPAETGIRLPPRISPEAFPVIADDLRRENLRAFMADWKPASPVWVFGYGSLIWRPDFDAAESRKGLLQGHYRSFCFWTIRTRGSTDFPGLGLGLRENDARACQGIAFRLRPEALEQDLETLWAREMLSFLYRPKRVSVETDQGPVDAITFVVDETHNQFVPDLDLATKAYIIARAAGTRGPCAEYLELTHESLERHGLDDPYIRDLVGAVRREAAQARR